MILGLLLALASAVATNVAFLRKYSGAVIVAPIRGRCPLASAATRFRSYRNVYNGPSLRRPVAGRRSQARPRFAKRRQTRDAGQRRNEQVRSGGRLQ